MANERLRPFRDYSEHDVLNLFAWDGGGAMTSFSQRILAGSVVKISTGFDNQAELSNTDSIGYAFPNTVSDRWNVPAKIQYAASGEVPLGITLYDVAEHDENGEALKFNPRKAAELQVAISGQAVPVATKGTFLVDWDSAGVGSATAPAVGSSIYASGDGLMTVDPLNVKLNEPHRIGKCLGAKDSDNCVLIKLEL